MLALTSLISGCAYQVAYNPDYVPTDTPNYIADGKILIVMPDEQQQFTYTGPPNSVTGDFTTLTVPLGEIVRDIARQTFTSCFAQGVEFADRFVPSEDYVVALEGDMQNFVYSYTKIIEQGFDGSEVDTWIRPEVDIGFNVRVLDRVGTLILDKTYDSGVVAGEAYRVSRRPAERINETLHATLHALMLQVAADIRPLLVGECTITDVVSNNQIRGTP
jgi:hypothetical protein